MTELRVLHVLPHGGGGGERYIELLADRLPWEFRVIEIARSPRWTNALTRMTRTLPEVRSQAPEFDIVTVHGDTAAVLVRPFLRNRPSIITTHGLSLLRRQRGLRGAVARWAIRSAIRAADFTVCTSTDERNEIDELVGGATADRLVTIPNGVELPPPVGEEERRRSRCALGVQEDEFAVVFVGDLAPHKDPLTAVRVVERLRKEGLSVRLLIAGDGELRATIEEIDSPSITVLGHQDDVRPVYAGADALLLPSPREGLSLVLLEAMSHGIPPIVSSGPGNVEGVGDAGITVPIGDIHAFAVAIAGLWRSPDKRVRLAERSRRRVAERYRIERVAEQWLSIYRRVAGDTAVGATRRAHRSS